MIGMKYNSLKKKKKIQKDRIKRRKKGVMVLFIKNVGVNFLNIAHSYLSFIWKTKKIG
ncbi:hypothetical protein HanRHA438_Chr08g0342581 [Helianthus annuus]|nr:hypothetical protein HanRHA438_Chr08g0342581 [Helianthus annuus]